MRNKVEGQNNVSRPHVYFGFPVPCCRAAYFQVLQRPECYNALSLVCTIELLFGKGARQSSERALPGRGVQRPIFS